MPANVALRHFIAFLVSLLATVACGDSSGPQQPPAALAVVGSQQLEGIVGQALESTPAVRVTDAMGNPVRGAPVLFQLTSAGGSITGEQQLTDGNGNAGLGGWTLHVSAGTNTVTAEVVGLSAIQFTAIGLPDAAESLTFIALPPTVTENETVAPGFLVELRDKFGNRATTSSAIVTLSLNQGPPTATVTGTTEVVTIAGLATFDNVTVSAPGLAAPVVSSIVPPIFTSGVAARITGQSLGFATQTAVFINGAAASISNQTPSELNIVAPEMPSDCEPLRNVPVRVEVRAPLFDLRLRASSSGFENATSDLIVGIKTTTVQQLIRTAPQLALSVGEARVPDEAETARCMELPDTPARYLVSVFSTNSSTVASTPFSLRGKASHLQVAPTTAAAFHAGALVRPALPARDSRNAHTLMLQQNIRILQETPHPLRGGLGALAPGARGLLVPPPPALAPTAVGTLGAINEFRYSFSSCGDGYTTIMGRTAWVGTRSIIVEDVAPFGDNPLNGTLDARYAQIGAEFDAKMWQIVLQNFGNPLLVDSQMANHGKVIMLFTPQVIASGAQAFVFSCDFFPRSTFPKSNEAPIFYARVPTLDAPGTNPDRPEGWHRVTRSTVIHETKHIAAYAERIMRSGLAGFEQPWLEEGGARIAEELFGRTFYNNLWKDNSTYLQTFTCDLNPAAAGTENEPFIMAKHFGATISPPALYDFLERSETSSVLCITGVCPDASFYASSWAMLRWATDHFSSQGEAQFLSDLTQDSERSGAANIGTRTGLSWTSIMGEWSLMLATDDRPGFFPLNPRLRFPSWNLRAVFAELHENFPEEFQKPYPLTPHQVPFGDFSFNIPMLVSGGFSLFELSGTPAGSQILELRGPPGGNGLPHSSLRMALVRVQ